MSTLTEAAPAAASAPVAIELTYREAVNAALEDAMAADPTVFLMGEDVDADGGVFKTNIGLPGQVPRTRPRDTHLRERLHGRRPGHVHHGHAPGGRDHVRGLPADGR